jgi:tetratricopeptide (TPR) repeat protein
VNRRTLLALPWVVACGRPDRRAQPALDPLLAAGRDFGETSAADDAFAQAELGRIAAQVERSRGGEAPVTARIERLNHVVFSELGFAREVESTALGCVLLQPVLRQRRGSCVGLGSLYLALAELLELPLSGVLLPGHFFVRASEAGRRSNIELLRGGEAMPDDWYRHKYPLPGPASAYDRALTKTEVRGVVEYDVGNERRRQGRLGEARRAFTAAVQHFPDFAEAHASLGSVLHLLGSLEAAELAYAAARKVNPRLPGLDWNLELLARERKNSSLPRTERAHASPPAATLRERR